LFFGFFQTAKIHIYDAYNKTYKIFLSQVIDTLMKLHILGVKIDNLTQTEVMIKIKEFLDSRQKYYVATVNPEMIVDAVHNKEFFHILNYADICIPDGFGIVLASFASKNKIKERFTGVDFLWKTCQLAEQNDYSVYFLGAKEGVAQAAANKVKKVFPQLRVAGYCSGGIIDNPKNVDKALIKKINTAKPDILFVAMNHVKQEKFIFYQMDNLTQTRLAVGVGGTFDYLSGDIKRAPHFMRKIGFEWFYRLMHEPKRLPRIYKATVVFPFLFLKYSLKKWRNK